MGASKSCLIAHKHSRDQPRRARTSHQSAARVATGHRQSPHGHTNEAPMPTRQHARHTPTGTCVQTRSRVCTGVSECSHMHLAGKHAAMPEVTCAQTSATHRRPRTMTRLHPHAQLRSTYTEAHTSTPTRIDDVTNPPSAAGRLNKLETSLRPCSR